MRQVSRGLLVVAIALAVGSCDGTADGDVGDSAPLPPADRAIAAQLYDGTTRTPMGFVEDPVPTGFTQVSTYHIKSSQVAAPAATVHELCTDDWNVALAWSEEVAAQASPYLDLVGNMTTARYFELDRVPRGQPERYVRMRVLRCSYLDRIGVDGTAQEGFAGTLNQRPLDAEALRDVSQYLWLFTSFNNVGHAVLASEPRSPGLAHALTIASLERAPAAAPCDRVTLREWTHAAGVGTGTMELTTEPLREFGVRRENGAIVGC